MAKLKLFSTILSKLSTLAKTEGNLVVCTDEKSLYFDFNGERFRVTDWIECDTEEDRLAILSPITSKFYLVKENNKLYKYVNSSWKCFNESINDQSPTYTETTTLTKLTSGEKLSVTFGKISKAITDLIAHIDDSTRHIPSNSTIGSEDTPIYINAGAITSTGKKFSDYLSLKKGGIINGDIVITNEDSYDPLTGLILTKSGILVRKNGSIESYISDSIIRITADTSSERSSESVITSSYIIENNTKLEDKYALQSTTDEIQSNKADKTEIPSKVSELTNDSGYITKADIPSSLPANGGNADTATKATQDQNGNTIDTTYLKLLGGTVTGKTYFNQGTTVYDLKGGLGSSGYMYAFQMKISNSYRDQTMCFKIAQRGDKFGEFKIRFASADNTDPSLEYFVKSGNIDVYIVKSATSTWDLYIKKSIPYDNISIYEMQKGSQTNDVSITFKNITVAELPSGYITATLETYKLNISGNANSATKATQDSDGNNINTTYLKRSGGTMTGDIVGDTNEKPNITAFNNISSTKFEVGEHVDLVYDEINSCLNFNFK